MIVFDQVKNKDRKSAHVFSSARATEWYAEIILELGLEPDVILFYHELTQQYLKI
jgi:hypothetical protein